jgi:MoaA/NifB/PqqE/SkfB family radical SAM enzyme
MDEALFERILSDLQGDHDMEWVFSGMGEPFEHPRLAAMVSALKGRRVRIETSLQPSPPEDFPWKSLSHLRISVDALEETWFSQMRPGCQWNHVERFVAIMAERKRQDPDHWPSIGVTLVKHRLNDSVALAFVKYWKKVTNAPFHSLFFQWPVDQPPANMQWFQVLGVSDFLGRIPWDGVIRYTPLNRRACRHGLLNMMIQQNGVIPICRFDIEGSHSLGCLAVAGEGPMAIWKSDSAREFRRRLLRREYQEERPCRTCMDWYHS